MELCWLTTSKCNQSCHYCDRFRTKVQLSGTDYLDILSKLIGYGVKHLTFGGGESLLVDNFNEIVKIAYDNGIRLKLVTNGKLIPQNIDLLNYFDEITLSIDSSDNEINEQLGRGIDHFANICTAIRVIKSNASKVHLNINSVVTKLNDTDIAKMGEQIKAWNIAQWRIFRFCPLRETAVTNRDTLEISDDRFLQIEQTIRALRLECQVQFRNYTDMESGYLLITPDGKLCISRDMTDVVVGDMLNDDLGPWFV